MSSNPIDWTALLALCETMSAPKNDAGAATRGHRELCAAWATEAKQQRATEEPRDDA